MVLGASVCSRKLDRAQTMAVWGSERDSVEFWSGWNIAIWCWWGWVRSKVELFKCAASLGATPGRLASVKRRDVEREDTVTPLGRWSNTPASERQPPLPDSSITALPLGRLGGGGGGRGRCCGCWVGGWSTLTAVPSIAPSESECFCIAWLEEADGVEGCCWAASFFSIAPWATEERAFVGTV